MSLTINIYYTGENGAAKRFAEEMVEKGVVDRVRTEEGNKKYEYFFPMDDKETVLLIEYLQRQRKHIVNQEKKQNMSIMLQDLQLKKRHLRLFLHY